MPKRKNLVGNVYGELQVIEMLYKYNGTNRTYCKCIGINDKEHKEYIIRQKVITEVKIIKEKPEIVMLNEDFNIADDLQKTMILSILPSSKR